MVERLVLSQGGLAHPIASSAECDPVRASALGCVRLAPSAQNLQPWRLVYPEGHIGLYEHRTLPPRAIGDVQLVDTGIAMLHLEAGLARHGVHGTRSSDGPKADAPDAVPMAPNGSMAYVSTISF
ncbi:nitroreductase family protein [Olsenella sp. Marseille-P4559]|uniref:nitroreductase family protein n=1 Tax=Olsenella sp. Marseille-P4559 TaxID=2364795 RepID=UPI0013EF54A3|nr:nitroreductase family protein [Olsenella sp. Marseille-P4559]